jgi:pyruvate formate-lyase activating enzyme-like uncharacterized protein
MGVFESRKKSYIEKIKIEYGKKYNLVKWISPDKASFLSTERTAVLKNNHGICSCAAGTKLFSGSVSPGCRLCMAGEWSCLFITGVCNGSCFYCPAPQNEDSLPVSQNIEFKTPLDYADYIEKLGFKGVGISGGEPLLKIDLCIEYIKALKNRFGKDLHIWLYTNGILGTREKFKELKNAGLDEIRFDIGAVGYSLDSVKKASEFFESLCVEIPAIPEDIDLLKVKLPEMADAGVKYLNLHQLRLTPYNFENLVSRRYTFCHGVKAVSAESEITALKLIDYSIEKKIDISINYCSFPYKNRFQSAAWRNKGGQLLKEDYDDITENAYLRRVFAEGSDDFLKTRADILKNTIGNSGWELKKNRLYFKFDLIPLVRAEKLKINIEYFEPRILPFITYYNYFKEIDINRNKSIAAERVKAFEVRNVSVSDSAISAYHDHASRILSLALNEKDREKILQFEQIEKGLCEYF